MARTRAIALLSVACLPLAACGSSRSASRDSAKSPPRYVAAAEAICTARLAQINRLTRPTTPEQAVSYLPQALTIMGSEIAELTALAPPAHQRAELSAALASTRQLASLLRGFLHQLRSGLVEIATFARVQTRSGALTAEADDHFGRAGLAKCAS